MAIRIFGRYEGIQPSSGSSAKAGNACGDQHLRRSGVAVVATPEIERELKDERPGGVPEGADIDQDELKQLAESAKDGSADAWEAIYRRAYPRLIAFASRRIGSEDARDAVNETVAKAIAKIERFEWRGGGFDAWIFAILRNCIADIQRRSTRFSGSEPEDVPDLDRGPAEYILDSEEADAVRMAFMRLPDADRELLELRVVGGLDSYQVAEVLGKKPGAIRTAQSRALIRLRTILDEVLGS